MTHQQYVYLNWLFLYSYTCIHLYNSNKEKETMGVVKARIGVRIEKGGINVILI